MVNTTVDRLPYGSLQAPEATGRVHKAPLPEGVRRRDLMRDIALIAWPNFMEILLTQLTSMVDQMMVGRLPGQEGIMALASVGLAAQPKLLLMTAIMAMNVGTTAMVARSRGQQNRVRSNQTFRQSLLLNIAIGVVLMIVGLLGSRWLIGVVGGRKMAEQTFLDGVTYLNIQLYGWIPLCIGITVTSALRGIGDTKTPLIYNTIANVVNVFLNYVMIYGNFGCPALGVRGAAWATIIGQTVAALIACGVILGKRHYLYVSFQEKFQYDAAMMKNVITIGFPAMMEQLIIRIGVIVFVSVVAGLGDTLFAAHQILMSIQILTFMIGQAFGNSTTALIGQSLGKCRFDIAQYYITEARYLGWAVALVLAACVITFNRQIIGLYNTNPDVIAAGAPILILLAFTQPFQEDQYVLAGGLRGSGDTRFPAIVVFVTTMVVRAGLSLLFVNVFHWGLWGAWIAIATDQLMRTGLMLVRYLSGKWKAISRKLTAADV
jgi:putative MATE family efflux protein